MKKHKWYAHPEVHTLGLAIHTCLCAGHCLGALYHSLKSRKDTSDWLYLAVHIGSGVFSFGAAKRHFEDSKKPLHK